ncbi:hypothetical protein R6Q59_015277 [Mikania micrantha]
MVLVRDRTKSGGFSLDLCFGGECMRELYHFSTKIPKRSVFFFLFIENHIAIYMIHIAFNSKFLKHNLLDSAHYNKVGIKTLSYSLEVLFSLLLLDLVLTFCKMLEETFLCFIVMTNCHSPFAGIRLNIMNVPINTYAWHEFFSKDNNTVIK